MDTGKQIGKAIASMVLLAVLMLPTAIQFFHSFEGHKQVDCKEQLTHIHKDVQDCQICHFHFTFFNYAIANYPDFVRSIVLVTVDNDFSSLLLHSFKVTNTQLRAPPYFLS